MCIWSTQTSSCPRVENKSPGPSSCGTPFKGRTIRKVMGIGVGEWGIFSLHDFFFRLLLVQEFFFFRRNPLHEFFFQTNSAFFGTVKSWFTIYDFVLYKLFYTHNRSKDTGHFSMQNLFENVHTVREEEATWSGRLPCAFFQSCPLEFLSHSPS